MFTDSDIHKFSLVFIRCFIDQPFDNSSKYHCQSCSMIAWVRAALKRTVVSDLHFDNLSGSHRQSQVKETDFQSGCRNICFSHCHGQQSFSGLPSPGRSHYTIDRHSRFHTLY